MNLFMTKLFFFAFSIFFLHSNSYSISLWESVDSPVSVNLRNCVFIDSLNGWASGDSGIIIHTTDGGNVFNIQNTNIDFSINDIFFLNKNSGWAIANEFAFQGTTILFTSNGGLNWNSSLFPDSTKFFKTIFFIDSLIGYIAGFGGIIYKTTNSGMSWNLSPVDSSVYSGFPINKIKFANNNLGFAAGGYNDAAGVIWRTSNAGQNWHAHNYSPEPFYDMFIKDPQNIISAGGDFEFGVQISTTSNGGNNWNYESLMLFGEAHSIDFRTSYEAWMALAYSRTLAVTYNSGQNWIAVLSADSSEIYSLSFPDSLHGFAVGNNGVILKYSPVITSVTENNSNSPSDFFLYQNFPNPFNPYTVISYRLSVSNLISLKVYDILGNEITTLVNQKQPAGNYRVSFKSNNLSSGIYFYKLTAGNFSETKRMVLIK